MATSCGKCSGALTVDVYRRVDEYANLCVQWENHGVTKGANWAAHLQNVGLDLSQRAS